MTRASRIRDKSGSLQLGLSSKESVQTAPAELGALLVDLINRVSHRGGKTLSLLNDAGVTLQQVIILSRLLDAGSLTSSNLARQLNMSLPSISQMVDRLFQLELVAREESIIDRRQKRLSVTKKGLALGRRIQKARAEEYEEGLAHLPEKLKDELKVILEKVWYEWDRTQSSR